MVPYRASLGPAVGKIADSLRRCLFLRSVNSGYNGPMVLKLPLGGLEFVLLFVLVGFALLVWRGIRRRGAFALASDSSLLPTLITEVRVSGKIRRMWRDAERGLPLVEIAIGKRLLIFCPTDHALHAETYRQKIGKEADIAAFGLATLAPGGADTIEGQIRDAGEIGITPDLLRFLHVGQLQNDYFAIGRVLSSREETWDGDPLTLYRLQTAPDLTLEVAAPRSDTPFPEGSMVHGSVRLFGYLGEETS